LFKNEKHLFHLRHFSSVREIDSATELNGKGRGLFSKNKTNFLPRNRNGKENKPEKI